MQYPHAKINIKYSSKKSKSNMFENAVYKRLFSPSNFPLSVEKTPRLP